MFGIRRLQRIVSELKRPEHVPKIIGCEDVDTREMMCVNGAVSSYQYGKFFI